METTLTAGTAAAAEDATATAQRGQSFDELGRGGGESVVQIWTLTSRRGAGWNGGAGAGPSTSSKRKRLPDENASFASMVLGLAHEGGFAFDVKWCRDQDHLGYEANVQGGGGGGSGSVVGGGGVNGGGVNGGGGGKGQTPLGVLAAALGNG